MPGTESCGYTNCWDEEVIVYGHRQDDDDWRDWYWHDRDSGHDEDDGGGGGGGGGGGDDPDPPACNSLSPYPSIGLPVYSVYSKNGLVQSIAGGTNNVKQCPLTPERSNYCDKISTLLNASFATLRVTRTASTGYSIGNLSFSVASNTYRNAFLDIERWFSVRARAGSGLGGLIAWQELEIDWTQYSWNGVGNPTNQNEGVYQIFAAFLLDLGQGSGITGLPRPGGNDDNSWSCPK